MSVVLVVGSAAGAVVMAVEMSVFSMMSTIWLIVELRVVDMMTGFTSLALLLNECLVLVLCRLGLKALSRPSRAQATKAVTKVSQGLGPGL